MENLFLTQLDEYFCAHYSDYVRLMAIEGYVRPELVVIEKDGSISKKDSELMRLCYQPNKSAVLEAFKKGYGDTDFTFSYSFIPFREKLKDRRRLTFSKLFQKICAEHKITEEEVGERLDIHPAFFQRVCMGKLYPEKNTILAVALVMGLTKKECEDLLAVCGFELNEESVRDVVVSYLLENRIHSEEMQDKCLLSYKIRSLPVKRKIFAEEDENA